MSDRNDPFKNARTTLANPIERLFVAPYWVNYHLEHHLLMWVPCYRLPRLRRFLLENSWGSQMTTVVGYLAVLAQVTVASSDDDGAPRRERAVGTFSDGFRY